MGLRRYKWSCSRAMSGHRPLPVQPVDLVRLLFIRKWEERLNNYLRFLFLNLGKDLA